MIFEFLLATILFFSIIFYSINYLSATASGFSFAFYSNSLYSKAIQISELLLKNTGTWDGDVPIVLGLASKWPVLSEAKIEHLNNYCESDFDDVLSKLDFTGDFSKRTVKINIMKGSETLLNCEDAAMPGSATVAHVKRFALSDQGSAVLVINIWVW